MKKTISIHLMGTNFLVEEDAYELVRDYLDRLNSSLRDPDDRKEIIEDVELRIAELATACINEKKQIVSLEEMQEILNTLGQPEEFLDEDERAEPIGPDHAARGERRLFRDTDNGVIAGICAGLSAYFKIDVAMLRVIFIILLFAGGFIIPLYIIMWLVVPKAKSKLERLQMHGRPINLETLKEEFDEATMRFSKTSKKFERDLSDKNSPIRKRIAEVYRILSKIVGSGLLILGSVGLIMLVFFGFLEVRMFHISEFNSQLNFQDLSDLVLLNDVNSFYLWLGSFITGLAITLFMILLGARLLFRLRSKWIKGSFLLLTLAGVTGIVISAYQGVKLGTDFTIAGEYEAKIGETSDPVLYVNILESISPDHVRGRNYRFDGELFDVRNGNIVGSGIDINYEVSGDSSFHVYVEYSALGNSRKKATDRSRNIVHKAFMQQNVLTIAPYYLYPKADKVRNQSVSLTIQIPEGKVVEYPHVKVHSSARDGGYIDEQGEYSHYDSDEDVWVYSTGSGTFGVQD